MDVDEILDLGGAQVLRGSIDGGPHPQFMMGNIDGADQLQAAVTAALQSARDAVAALDEPSSAEEEEKSRARAAAEAAAKAQLLAFAWGTEALRRSQPASVPPRLPDAAAGVERQAKRAKEAVKITREVKSMADAASLAAASLFADPPAAEKATERPAKEAIEEAKRQAERQAKEAKEEAKRQAKRQAK